MDLQELEVEVQVPINIALIKYWGKRDEDLILPLNDSISLSIDDVFAKTLLRCVPGCAVDSVTINGEVVDLNKHTRFRRCFSEARRLLRKRSNSECVDSMICPYSFQVNSNTNFPVAAGLASSAAGFAAIAFALGQLFSFNLKDVSRIARIGSGSACRSVFEGLTQWKAGSDPYGLDCYAEQLFPANHWPELRAVVVILNETKKTTGSTNGMKATVMTSDLLKYRVEKTVPERIKRIIKAFEHQDFPEFAKITMADSNQFHAVCLDTFPPLKYMSDASWEVVRLVNEMNHNSIKAAYTFDAGPNACIFLLKDYVSELLQRIYHRFTITSDLIDSLRIVKDDSEFLDVDHSNKLPTYEIKNIIVSSIGCGPKVI